jgi:hypothetical protein
LRVKPEKRFSPFIDYQATNVYVVIVVIAIPYHMDYSGIINIGSQFSILLKKITGRRGKKTVPLEGDFG